MLFYRFRTFAFSNRRRLACCTALGLLAHSGICPARAQTPAAAGADTAVAVDRKVPASQLEQVVVTARRRTEKLQSVPVAVTVFSGAAITAQKISAPADLNSKVPSLSVDSGTNARDSSIYSIRGQGEGFAGSEPAVITYLDEVPTIATGPGLLFDLENLQVLKGPQGTLFGRNTTGGAILLVPQHPSNKLGGYFDETIGDYGLVREQGALNVPIVDEKLMARFAFDVNERDGFTKDAITGRLYDDRDYKAYRFGLTARPTDYIENYFLFNYATSNTADSGVQILSVNTNPATTLVPITLIYPGILQALKTQQMLGIRQVEHDLQDGYSRTRNLGFTNTTTVHITDDIFVKNIFGYRDFLESNAFDIDGTRLPILQGYASSFYGSGSLSEPSTRSFTDELQLQGKSFGGKLSWILGLYDEYQKPGAADQQDLITQFAFLPLPGIQAATYSYQSLKQDRSQAVFGQFTYDLSSIVPNLKFTAGGRYTQDWRSQTSSNFPILQPCPGAAAAGLGYCNLSLTAPYHAPTGTVSLDYQVTPKTLLYVASRRGYKSGGFNVTAPTAAERTFGPEYITDVELGEKTDFKLGGVEGRINADVYRGMFTSLQENGTIFANGQELTVTQNAGEGVVQGVELEGQLIPTRNLLLSGFYSYIDAHYDKNEFNGVDLRSIPFLGTPKHKLSISGTYTFDLPPGIGDVSFTAQYSYQSRVFFATPLIPVVTDPRFGQPGYSLVNLHADWKNIFGHPFDLTGFVTNLTNRSYLIFQNESYNITGFSTGIYGEPRMFGFEGRYHF